MRVKQVYFGDEGQKKLKNGIKDKYCVVSRDALKNKVN